VGPLHWECAVAGDTNAAGRNRSAIWFSYRLHGLAGQRVTLELTDLWGEWNLRPSTAFGATTRPVVGYGDSWRRLTGDEVSWEGEPGAERLRLTFEVPRTPASDGDGVEVSYIEPYTYGDHRRFVDGLLADPPGSLRHSVLGQSPEGRSIDLLSITGEEAQGAIWLIHRQHPWETYSSYVAEVIVRRLLENPELRRGHTWQIVPMANPDGCFHGHTRHNTIGKDPNREWNESVPTPEVACIRNAIAAKLGGEPVFFLDTHNNDQNSGDYLAASNLTYGATQEEAVATLDRYETLVSTIASDLAAGSHFSGTVRQVARPAAHGPLPQPGEALTTEQAMRRMGKPFAFPSALLEMRTGQLPTRGGAYGTLDDQRRFGQALVDAIARALHNRAP
jgi:hypothetical protein